MALANIINLGIPAYPAIWGLTYELTPGLITPASKVSGAGYVMVGSSPSWCPTCGLDNIGTGVGGAVSPWEDGATNAIFLGKQGSSNGLGAEVLTSEEAFNLDQKIVYRCHGLLR